MTPFLILLRIIFTKNVLLGWNDRIQFPTIAFQIELLRVHPLHNSHAAISVKQLVYGESSQLNMLFVTYAAFSQSSVFFPLED